MSAMERVGRHTFERNEIQKVVFRVAVRLPGFEDEACPGHRLTKNADLNAILII